MKKKVDPEVVIAKLKRAGVDLNSWTSIDEANRSGVLTPEEMIWFSGIEHIKPAAWKKDEAAAYLNISTMTLLRLVRSGEVPHTRVGRSLRFRKVDLDRYLEAQTSKTWAPHGTEDGGE